VEGIFDKKSDILKALAHPTRLKIVELLRDGERCVCEMIPLLKEEQSNLSKHLASLRQAGIVGFRKEGVSIYYRIRHEEVLQIIDIAEEMVKKEMVRTVELLEKMVKE